MGTISTTYESTFMILPAIADGKLCLEKWLYSSEMTEQIVFFNVK